MGVQGITGKLEGKLGLAVRQVPGRGKGPAIARDIAPDGTGNDGVDIIVVVFVLETAHQRGLLTKGKFEGTRGEGNIGPVAEVPSAIIAAPERPAKVIRILGVLPNGILEGTFVIRGHKPVVHHGEGPFVRDVAFEKGVERCVAETERCLFYVFVIQNTGIKSRNKGQHGTTAGVFSLLCAHKEAGQHHHCADYQKFLHRIA